MSSKEGTYHTGTGTFITRLIQSGLIEPKDLERKYKSELHANEIVLLAYYIASINIENAFHDSVGESVGQYTPFDGICLTDTFQMYEDKDNDVERLKFADVFPQNSERVIAQSKVPMRIIVGNPPYSIGQTSANDNNQNEYYPRLEKRIADTYGRESNAVLQKGLYDSYVKALRYASDILADMGGIIGFVTNAGWLDGNAMDGLRKCFEKEFTSIYIYNLRGNARTSGELRRKEKDNVFGQGTRTPIAITILVRNPKKNTEKATIYYREVDDYLSREDKLKDIVKQKSVLAKGFVQKILQPNSLGDWLTQRSDVFGNYVAIEPAINFNIENSSVFSCMVVGISTNRDAWVYNYGKKSLMETMRKLCSNYNQEREAYKKTHKLTEKKNLVSWTVNLKKYAVNDKELFINDIYHTIGNYRPFCKQHLYYDRSFIERPGKWSYIFPTAELHNLVFALSGIGSSKDFSILISDKKTGLDFNEKTQCFPLYWYEEKVPEKETIPNLFAETVEEQKPVVYVRHDGVTDYILNEARSKYKSNAITKEDIFYYVYGLLHSEDYRTQFAADLKKMLPRLPLVENAADFKAFMTAGRKLAELHLDYEKRPAPAEVVVEGDTSDCTVTKMKFKSKADKSTLIYNNHITIKNIPLEAYEYVVNGKSAIEWIMDRYQVKVDKNSQIENNPNDWSKEHNDPKYILDLLLSIITVSLETRKIVKGLPKIKFE